MNKLSILVLLLLLFSLCSCSGQQEQQEQQDRPPQSVPELESIIEPIAGEDVSEKAQESSSGAYGDAPVVVSQPVPETGHSEPAVYMPEPQAPAKTEEPANELLGAMAPDASLDSAAIEKELLRLINALRDEEGANALGIEDSIQFAARIRAAEALESFSHTRPDGATYNTAFDEAGFSYAGKWHGENLSSLSCSYGMFDEKEIALEMFKGLKNSPGHYRNMAEQNFVQAGVGVAISYGENTVSIASAQMFSSL